LARLLPLVDAFDVYLLGTGLPSFWVAHMGEMMLTLGLSGWTTNDWTRGSALDLLSPPAPITETIVQAVARQLKDRRSMSLIELTTAVSSNAAQVQAVLRRLAFSGQVIHDLPNGVYRFRQVMPMPLTEELLGPENEELNGARQLTLKSKMEVDSLQKLERSMILIGKVDGSPVEIMVDLDGRIRRGKCVCGHYRKFGIRNGPCRHMIALRTQMPQAASAGAERTSIHTSSN
jgi:hypothetical protein